MAESTVSAMAALVQRLAPASSEALHAEARETSILSLHPPTGDRTGQFV